MGPEGVMLSKIKPDRGRQILHGIAYVWTPAREGRRKEKKGKEKSKKPNA